MHKAEGLKQIFFKSWNHLDILILSTLH